MKNLSLYLFLIILPSCKVWAQDGQSLGGFKERVKELLLEDFTFRTPLHNMKDLFCDEWNSGDWKKELEDREYAHYEDYEAAANEVMDKIIKQMISLQKKNCRLLGEGRNGAKTQIKKFVFSQTNETDETELEEKAYKSIDEDSTSVTEAEKGKKTQKNQKRWTWKLSLAVMMKLPESTTGNIAKEQIEASAILKPSFPVAVSIEDRELHRYQLQERIDEGKKRLSQDGGSVKLSPEISNFLLDAFYLRTLSVSERNVGETFYQAGGGISYRQQTQFYSYSTFLGDVVTPISISFVALNAGLSLRRDGDASSWEFLTLYVFGIYGRGHNKVSISSLNYHEILSSFTFYPFGTRKVNIFLGPFLRAGQYNMTIVPAGQDSSILSSRELFLGGFIGFSF